MTRAALAPRRPSRLEYANLDSRCYPVRRWGSADGPPLLLLHGWMDTSITFQFLVDALASEWNLIAPDWPGYGDAPKHPAPYSMYADIALLDQLVTWCSPSAPVTLIGHSYGGQIATFYAGARPQRVARYVSLEGFGSKEQSAAEAPTQLADWLEQRATAQAHRPYRNVDGLARRLSHANPRLSAERAAFLAGHIGERRDDDSVVLKMDPWRRLRGMLLSFPPAAHYQAFLSRIAAPALWLYGDSSRYMSHVFPEPALYQARFQCLARGQQARINDAGHNLHHDQPEQVAAHLERFLAATGT